MKLMSIVLILSMGMAAKANECQRETDLRPASLSTDYLILGITGSQLRNVPDGRCWELNSSRLEKFEGDCSRAYEYFQNRTDRFECYQSTEARDKITFLGKQDVVDFYACYLCESQWDSRN